MNIRPNIVKNKVTKIGICESDLKQLSKLKIISWNIQSSNDIEGNKFKRQDFMKIINQGDILCLQEVRQVNKISGFRSKHNLRDGSNSGGVSINYKNFLHKGIEEIKKYKMDDLLICKLRKKFFKLENDIFIINAYVTPQNSSAKVKRDGKEMLIKISDIVNELKVKGGLIICGDFNARIADSPGLIRHDEDNNHLQLPDDYVPDEFTPRNSQDQFKNAFCTNFLSLVKNNRLKILNGRTLGDLSGAYTCIKSRGCSVVDYFATTSDVTKNVLFLEVLPFTHFSDHCPVQLTMKTNKISVTEYQSIDKLYDVGPSRYIIHQSMKENFTNAQETQEATLPLNELNDIISSFATQQPLPTREQISDVNLKFTKHLQDIANSCFKKTKSHITKKKKNSEPWFNRSCKEAKKDLQKASRTASEYKQSEFLRVNFYHVKKFYRTLVDRYKKDFFDRMNKDIENGKIINWQQFKRLKQYRGNKLDFDSLDMTNFEEFFKSLYADEHATINSDTKNNILREADDINEIATNQNNTNDKLNCRISTEEISHGIRLLKSGKASADDMIANELLKWLNTRNIETLRELFNICLDSGVYPWNTNIITPLHKKGTKEDPDNYRAVAVSSTIGKLFSTILLERFKEFRRQVTPEPPNQLGFTKNAQTYDHILTLQTIASKYKKLKTPVYAIFVDFSKAFDSVCRQALFLKLAQSNATGKFYSVLRDMYTHSVGRIKLSGHLSNTFNIEKGTEQGHPLSPDLFKLYLKDLSPDLDLKNCPVLADTLISHLLWADDLILLSLDTKTTQKQLDILNNFCTQWGLEPNIGKTKAMIIGYNDKRESTPPEFLLGKLEIEVVDEYCYLGIIINKSGSLKTAQTTLKDKAMRAFFGLKRTINRTKISFKAATTLFDSLIKPISLYGAPVWLPTSPMIKNILSSINNYPNNLANLTNKIARTPWERPHISYLRWILGVHKKSSIIGLWGETGRFPLVYQSIKLTLNYFKRLTSKQIAVNSFVHAALTEQMRLNLPWYRNIQNLAKLDEIYLKDDITAFKEINKNRPEKISFLNVNKRNYSQKSFLLISELSHLKVATKIPSKQFRIPIIMDKLRYHFIRCWKFEKNNSTKLSLFYDKIKKCFEKEQYLDYVVNSTSRYMTTKIRISAHDLEIETGRYKNIARDKRTCKWCQLSLGLEESNNKGYTSQASCSLEKYIENENHVLFECDLYHDLRKKLITTLKNMPKKFLDVDTDGAVSDDRNNVTAQIFESFKNINQTNISSSFSKLQSNMYNITNYQHTSPTQSQTATVIAISTPINITSIPKTNPSTFTNSTDKIKFDPLQFHFSRPNYANENSEEIDKIRSYLQNALSAFIKNCLNKRKKFLEELVLSNTQVAQANN